MHRSTFWEIELRKHHLLQLHDKAKRIVWWSVFMRLASASVSSCKRVRMTTRIIGVDTPSPSLVLRISITTAAKIHIYCRRTGIVSRSLSQTSGVSALDTVTMRAGG